MALSSSLLRRIRLCCLLLILAVLTTEVALQLLCRISAICNSYLSPLAPAGEVSVQVAHPVLRRAPNPEFPDHDFRGYRNVGLQTQFDIVALGDSQTYGMGSEMWEAWPQQLEFSSGRSVYNMGFGGWTVVQFSYLMDDVFALEPDTVIFGLYATRFFGAYQQVYYRGNGLRFIKHGDDPLQFLVDRGVVEPVSTTRQKIYEQDSRIIDVTDPMLGASRPTFESVSFAPKVRSVPYVWRRCKLLRIGPAVERFLLHRCRPWYRWVYRRTGQLPTRMNDIDSKAPVPKPKSNQEVKESLVDRFNGRVKIKHYTDERKRMFGMDLRDVRVAEGFRVTMEALKEMGERCRAREIRFVVLWIPTKEATMYNWLVENYQRGVPEKFHQLYACESLLRHATFSYLSDQSIDVVDGLPRLQACYENDIMPYRFDRDGHPNRIGYRILAEAVCERLQVDLISHTPLRQSELDHFSSLAFPQHHGGGVNAEQVFVNAILRDPTEPLTVEAIRPYSDALVAHTYEVVDVRRGKMELGLIQVLHWAVQDGAAVSVPRTKESVEPLVLEPSEMHPQLVDIYTVDDTENDFDLPLYFCVGR